MRNFPVAERCKWFRRYKDLKNHPAQLRRERWLERWINRQRG